MATKIVKPAAQPALKRVVKPPVKAVPGVPKAVRPVTPEEHRLQELKELDRMLTRMISGTEDLHKRADKLTEQTTGLVASAFEQILKAMRRTIRQIQRQPKPVAVAAPARPRRVVTAAKAHRTKVA